jgi:SAM-dependent methyltransferase
VEFQTRLPTVEGVNRWSKDHPDGNLGLVLGGTRDAPPERVRLVRIDAKAPPVVAKLLSFTGNDQVELDGSSSARYGEPASAVASVLRRPGRAEQSRAASHGDRMTLLPSALPDAAPLNLNELSERWWYYSVELEPGRVAAGVYPPDVPMLPRVMLRRCEAAGLDCLDIGCMEGLIATLLARRQARRVVATDASDHCWEKLAAVRRQYAVNFDFRQQHTVYDLDRQFPDDGFDLINLSGLLYHVFSPLNVLCGVRPLLKRNGLLLVSTNVLLEPGYGMEFNAFGRMQIEANTFVYPTVPLLDYWLRYLRLAPLDVLHLPHTAISRPVQLGTLSVQYAFDRPSAYLAVVCRAVDEALPTRDDPWMGESARLSWEYRRLVDWDRCAGQPLSAARYHSQAGEQFRRSGLGCLDLWQAVQRQEPFIRSTSPADSHLLRLADRN